MRRQTIHSVSELVGALGGLTATAAFFGVTPQLMFHWRRNNRIPTKFHLVHTAKLAAKGIHAPVQLWGFVQEAAE
jgi:hypothetical protein